MARLVALTREVSPEIARCQLTFREREPIDRAQAVEQHRAYCDLLGSLGLEVLRLPADRECPDCCFVEDTAVVLDELAVVTHLGSPARRPETPVVEQALSPYRPIRRLGPPATLDGGDVLRVGRTLFVGLSSRTSPAGFEALREIAAPLGYQVVAVAVKGCLHLKSGATAIGDESILANPEWVDLESFRALDVLPVPPEEPWAANVLRLGEAVVAHAGFPRTLDLLRGRGLPVSTVDVSELLKAEAGVTCLSIVFPAAPDVF